MSDDLLNDHLIDYEYMNKKSLHNEYIFNKKQLDKYQKLVNKSSSLLNNEDGKLDSRNIIPSYFHLSTYQIAVITLDNKSINYAMKIADFYKQHGYYSDFLNTWTMQQPNPIKYNFIIRVGEKEEQHNIFKIVNTIITTYTLESGLSFFNRRKRISQQRNGTKILKTRQKHNEESPISSKSDTEKTFIYADVIQKHANLKKLPAFRVPSNVLVNILKQHGHYINPNTSKLELSQLIRKYNLESLIYSFNKRAPHTVK